MLSMASALAVPVLDLLAAAAVVLLVLALQNSSLEGCKLCALVPFRADAYDPAVVAVAVFALATVSRHLMEWLFLRQSRSMVQAVARNFAYRLTDRYLSMSWLKFATEGRAATIKNCTGTALSAAGTYTLLLSLFRSLASLLLLSIGVLIQTPLLGASFLFIAVLSLFLIRRFLQPRIKAASREQEGAMRDYHKALVHTFDASREVRVYGVRKVFMDAVEAPLKRLAWARSELATLPSIPWMLFDGGISLAIAFIVMLAIAANGAQSQALLLADLGLMVVVARQIVPSANGVLTGIAGLTERAVSLDIIHRELMNPQHESGFVRGTADTGEQALLSMRNVSFGYPNNPTILNGLNLEVRRGDRIALVGPSGSGKSSLLMLAAGLVSPTDGSIWVRDADQTAYVPQETALLDDTILNNVVFGLDRVDEAAVWAVLADVHLESFVRHLPQGLATMAGDNGVRLSGGQRQRLGIARALYRQPKLLLLDEATSALDPLTESIVMDSVVRSTREGAVLFVTHRSKAAEKASWVYTVEKGRLSPGGPEESREIERSTDLQA